MAFCTSFKLDSKKDVKGTSWWTHVIPTVKENINSAYMKDVYFANAAKGDKIFCSLKG